MNTYTATYYNHTSKTDIQKNFTAESIGEAQVMAFELDAKRLAEHKIFEGRLSFVSIIKDEV